MAISVHRELDRGMPQLVANVGQRLTLSNKKAGEGVPKVMESNPTQAHLGEDLIEDSMSQIVAVERTARLVAEDPVGKKAPAILERYGLARRQDRSERFGQLH